MVGDTNLNPPPLVKSCSRCSETKEFDKFIPKRNICKECDNKRHRENRKVAVVSDETERTCSICNHLKPLTSFIQNRGMCKDCNNAKRRNRYQTDEIHRQKAIQSASEFKHAKIIERQQQKLEEIGEGNKRCSCCSTIKQDECFRYNRLKCKTCEKDDPGEKFKRSVRGRIWSALKYKTMHTVEYLGCTAAEYLQWILCNDNNYTLDNRGKEWHIDHVIPLCRFDLDNSEQQLIAFNWRNTMPLSANENLKKNSKILPEQIEQHLKKLIDYHREKKILLPQIYIDLFAKHLVDGNPLKQSLPLQFGNTLEELG
jgi:hypothetical protein